MFSHFALEIQNKTNQKSLTAEMERAKDLHLPVVTKTVLDGWVLV